MVSTSGSLLSVTTLPSLRVTCRVVPSDATLMDLMLWLLISATRALKEVSSVRGVEVRAKASTAYATTNVMRIIGIKLFLRPFGILAVQTVTTHCIEIISEIIIVHQ